MQNVETAFQQTIHPDLIDHGRYDIKSDEIMFLYRIIEKGSEGVYNALLTAFNYGFIQGEKKATAEVKRA